MGRLARLLSRRDRRRRGRRRQLRLFRRTGKRGHARKAAEHGRAMRKLAALIEKVRALYSVAPGPPRWGGSRQVMIEEVRPVADRFGAPRTSSKRGAKHVLTLLNPGSDHSVLNLLSFADDYGTLSGGDLAHAIADALGISGYRTGTFTHYFIERRGHTYRVQILWAVSGHFDHVHVGIERVS